MLIQNLEGQTKSIMVFLILSNRGGKVVLGRQMLAPIPSYPEQALFCLFPYYSIQTANLRNSTLPGKKQRATRLTSFNSSHGE